MPIKPSQKIIDYQSFRCPGRYHTSGVSSASLSSQAMTANRFYATPFFVPENQSFDRIAIIVQVAAAASNVRIGIYEDNGSTYPGALVLDAGVVSGAAQGTQEINISQTLGRNKLYWLVCISDGTPSIYSVGSGIIGAGVNIIGKPFYAGAPGAIMPTGYYLDGAYGALPNPFTGGATANEANTPTVFLRA